MKITPFNVVVIVLFQFLSFTAYSQNTAGLNSLLDKKTEFIFPQTPENVSKSLNTKTIFYEDANGEKYAKWPTKSGLELYSCLGKNNVINEMFFDVSDHKVMVIGDLPYGLVMNKTTLDGAKTQFKKNGAKVQKLGADSEFPGGSQLVFKKEKHFTTLLFDAENLLRALSITTDLADPAAN